MVDKKKSFLKCAYAVMLLFCAFVVILLTTANYSENLFASVMSIKEMLTGDDVIVIDAGHGGMDGGAESSAGICEKEINLAICMKIREMAKADGWKVIMTREGDTAVKYDKIGFGKEQEKKSIRMTKTEDLLARKDMIDKEKPLLAVSVHLNSFKEDSRVRGSQVFYTNSGSRENPEEAKILEDSQRLGEAVQKSLVDGLQDGTDRKAMGKKDVRLLKDPKAPTIIVECGFLSNEEEALLLNEEVYQEKLAKLIYAGIMEYSNKMPKVKINIIDSRV